MEINIYGNSIYALVGPGLMCSNFTEFSLQVRKNDVLSLYTINALVGPGLMCSNFTVSFLYKSGKYSLLSFYTINALVGPDFEILIRNFYK